MKIVIPSKGRPQNVARMTSMFPTAVWCVDPTDFKAYRLPRKSALVHSSTVIGLPAKRQWILDHVDDETVFMIDDDVRHLFCNVGLVGRIITNPESIQRVLENTLELAKGFGTPLFGYAKHADVRKYNPVRPFNLASWVGTSIGIIGRPARFTTKMTARADIDFSLRILESHRIVLADERFAFCADRFTNVGGSASVRTRETDRADLEFLKREWGPYVEFKETKRGIAPTIHVQRQIQLQI